MTKKMTWYSVLTFLLSFSLDAQISIGSTDIDTSTVIGGLDTPWEMLWGPDDRIWITERMGRVSIIDPETGSRETILEIDEVHEQSESGLLGMALHPAFQNNGYVYLVYNYLDNSNIREKLVRYTYSGGILQDPATILQDIGGSGNHNGSRLCFGEDTTLYMTTGDAVNTSTSQDTSSLNGKILRINPDGSIPEDNPFPGSYLWTFGHRNPQGLVFSDSGLLYSSEHGPANDDELNRIIKSGNYGWPEVHGFCDQASEVSFCDENQVVEPLAAWTPTLAVAGIDYYAGNLITEWEHSILMVSLKAGRLTMLKLSSNGQTIEDQAHYFVQWWGRLRDVCVAPDGTVYIATSNRDGRGDVRAGDDRIIKISAQQTTGSRVPGSNGITIWPNPNRGKEISLGNLPPDTYRIRIYAITGKRVFDQVIDSDASTINISAVMNPGIYLVRVEGQNAVFVRRMVIR